MESIVNRESKTNYFHIESNNGIARILHKYLIDINCKKKTVDRSEGTGSNSGEFAMLPLKVEQKVKFRGITLN